MLLLGTSVGLEDEPLSTRLLADVSASAITNPIAAVDVSSAVVWSGISEMLGGELAAEFTVSTKVSFAVKEPSLTITVIVAVPD